MIRAIRPARLVALAAAATLSMSALVFAAVPATADDAVPTAACVATDTCISTLSLSPESQATLDRSRVGDEPRIDLTGAVEETSELVPAGIQGTWSGFVTDPSGTQSSIHSPDGSFNAANVSLDELETTGRHTLSLTFTPTNIIRPAATFEHTFTVVKRWESFTTIAGFDDLNELALEAVSYGKHIMVIVMPGFLGSSPARYPFTGTITLLDNGKPVASSVGGGLFGDLPDDTTPADPGMLIWGSRTLSAGEHVFTATYTGDDVREPSRSLLNMTVLVDAIPASATGKTSATAAAFGSPITLSTTVTAAGLTPTGAVEFFAGATSLGASTLNAAGTATLVTNRIPAGAHKITAKYAGDLRASDTTAALGTVTVSAAKTTATVGITATNPRPGAPAKITAKLCSTVAPTGPVVLAIGSVKSTVANGTSSGACTTYSAAVKLPAVGSYAPTVAYAATASHARVSASGAALKVQAWATTATAKLKATSVAVGAKTTVTVTVAAPQGAGTPAGSVKLRVNGTAVGSAVKLVKGKATLTIPAQKKAGKITISATYSPASKNYGSSTTKSSTLTVKAKQ